MSDEISNTLLRLEPSDRARLGEALRMLLDRGSILLIGAAESEAYQLGHPDTAHFTWLDVHRSGPPAPEHRIATQQRRRVDRS